MQSRSTPCPDQDTLAALGDGMLSDDERARVEGHTESCAECGELLDALAMEPGPAAAGANGDAPDSTPIAGDELGGYRLERELGRGAYGVVFEATDLRLGRKVAFKVLRRQDPGQRVRVQREAQALARLRHPAVVTVFDAGEARGRPFVVMELIEGVTLERFASGKDPSSIVRLFVAAGRGLAAAHHAGVLHRDFKPSNVMVTSAGQPQVVDFGQAIVGDGEDEALVVGTPAYMAPEQHRARAVDARADQYAFAVSLVRTLLGRSPFPSREPRALLASKEEGVVLPRAELALPAGLLDALERALAPNPADRFDTLDALLDELEHPIEHLSARRRIMIDIVPWLAAGLFIALLPIVLQRPVLLIGVAFVAVLVTQVTRVDPSRWRGHGFTVVMPYALVGALWASHLAAIENVSVGYRNSVAFASMASVMLLITALWARPLTSLLCGVTTGLGYVMYWLAYVAHVGPELATGAESFVNMTQRAMVFVGVGLAAAGLARALRRYTNWFSDERPDPR